HKWNALTSFKRGRLHSSQDRRRLGLLSLPYPHLLDTVDRQLDSKAVEELNYVTCTRFVYSHSSLCHSLSEVIQSS
ncbi:hypothetical protein GBAR_LOCUS11636, partial [Geodia barretti]